MNFSEVQKMSAAVPENLKKLASVCQLPLYIVGGSVRDFLAGKPLDERADWDITSPMSEDALLDGAAFCGFTVKAVYRNTGTVKLKDSFGVAYEFTRFRSDRYVRGLHAPSKIFFTDDILLDARRRDFCANAVYFDVAREEYCDPLGGIKDIQDKILRTVAPAEKVFGEDGLRLMRLARFAAQTGFAPDAECLAGARRNAALIRDIVPERIFAELNAILHADDKGGEPYRGLLILRETGVLREILPELAAGDGMRQRDDFHDHDVLEHTFRCVKYAPSDIRWAALLHDVGKPACFLEDGNFYAHHVRGETLAREILARLKAPKHLIEETAELVLLHMRDLDGRMKESKVRREIVKYYPLLEKLLALRQADYSACKDDLSPAPHVLKWRRIMEKMRSEGVPFTLSELAVKGDELIKIGIPPRAVGDVLLSLLDDCAEDGARNEKNRLLKRAERWKL